jgi:lysophospholipase L1-like esterase
MEKYMMRFTAIWALILLALLACETGEAKGKIGADHPYIQYLGRFEALPDGSKRFACSASEIRVKFTGTQCRIFLQTLPFRETQAAEDNQVLFRIQVDGKSAYVETVQRGDSLWVLAPDLAPGEHRLSLFRRTEANTGISVFKGLTLDAKGELLPPDPLPERKIEFYGNSITCGYGNEGKDQNCDFSPATENAWETYAAYVARDLQAELRTICYSGKGVWQNYSQSREGTLPQIYDRYWPDSEASDWDFARWQADAVVINLGTNDFARGIPDSLAFTKAYLGFVKELRNHYPESHIFLLSGPMLTGQRLQKLQSYLKGIASALDDTKVYRFALSTQGPHDYGCDWHPSLAQHYHNGVELSAYISEQMIWD